MNIERRWKAALFKRVVFNAFAGAVLTAIVGALCGLIVSAIIVWLENALMIALKIPPAPGFDAIMTRSLTASLAMLGALLGAIIFAIAAARAQPGKLFEPLQSLAGRVLLGQIAGVIGFCSLYLSVEAARAALTNQSFYKLATDDLIWLIIGPPILMVCGAIAGVLSKRH